MLKLGGIFRKFCAFGRGILVLAFLLFVASSMRLLPMPAKERLTSAFLSTVFYPVQYLVASVDDFRNVLGENEKLKEENARLRLEFDYARDGLRELVRLRALVRFDNHWDYPIVTSRIIGRNPGRLVTTLIVNRGLADGLKTDMPVFSMSGLVGRVAKVASHHAQVQVIVDPNLKFSVLNMRTRTVGFAESFDGKKLAAIVPAHAGIREGDTLVTSGLGGIFPKGIGVGVVKEIVPHDMDVLSTMVIQPFQEVSQLEEVFIMQKEPDWIVRELLE
ncbi:MAG: rod shape-determining protein MreC [Fibrobacteraceae bacterium]|nr:rod shape-determining protein MreC [Fibrobacteraceae bacterium]